MPSKQEKKTDKNNKKSQTKSYTVLSSTLLAKTKNKKPGYYQINHTTQELIEIETTPEAFSALKGKPIVCIFRDGKTYFGEFMYEITQNSANSQTIHIRPHGEGALYDSRGKIEYLGKFYRGKESTGVMMVDDKQIPVNKKGDKDMVKHSANEVFISFAHNMDKGNGTGSRAKEAIKEHKMIAKKYEKDILYDLTRFKGDIKNGTYDSAIRNITEDYKQKKTITENVNVFNIRLDDHGGDHTMNFYKNGEFQGKDVKQKCTTARMGSISDAIIENISRSTQNEIIIRLSITCCHGATIGRDDVELISELKKKIKEHFPNKKIALYVEKTRQGHETTSYNREYKQGFESVGLSSDVPRIFTRILVNSNEEKTYNSKTEYRNELKSHKEKIGAISSLPVTVVEQKDKEKIDKKEEQRQEESIVGGSDFLDNSVKEIVAKKLAKERKKATFEIKDESIKYQEDKVDMNKFSLSSGDVVVLICLCATVVLFPLAFVYHDHLKKKFKEKETALLEQKKINRQVKLFNLNEQRRLEQENNRS